MKKNLLLIVIIFQSLLTAAQRFEWVSHSTQAIPNTWSPDAVDPAGNIYALIGTTSSGAIIQGDTIPGVAPGNGVIVAKFNPSGNLLWGTMVSCDNGVIGQFEIAVDNSGAVYSVIEFGNGGNVNMLDTVFSSGGGGGAVIIKLDSSGHFLHSKNILNAYGPRLAGLGTDIYVSSHNNVEKLDSALNTVWLVSAPSGSLSFCSNGNGGADLFAGANGELLASCVEGGNSTGAIPFSNDSIYFSAPGYNEVAIVKMDTSGQVLWSRTFPSAGITVPAVCLDSHGNAYLGVQDPNIQYVFAGDTLYNTFTGSSYSAVLKWDSAGTPLWARGMYSAITPQKVFDMAVNAQEELLISGHAPSNISFNYDTLLSAVNDIYLIKISPAGNFIWYKSTTSSLGTTVYADGIAVRNGNEYILTGSTHNPATYQFGCISYTTPLYTNFVTFISENPEAYPVASFTFSVSNDTTYTFTDASANATSWHWDFGDGDTSNAQNPSHDFTSGGNYTVILTVHNGPCSSSDTLQLLGVGINEAALSSSFSVEPNPVANELRIKSSKSGIESVDVYDLIGEKILHSSLHGEIKMMLDVRMLPAGIYFVVVSDEKNILVTRKIVKM